MPGDELKEFIARIIHPIVWNQYDEWASRKGGGSSAGLDLWVSKVEREGMKPVEAWASDYLHDSFRKSLEKADQILKLTAAAAQQQGGSDGE